jgi:hypothetical protein
MRFILILLLFSSPVYADDYPAVKSYTVNGASYGDLESACQAKQDDYDTVYDDLSHVITEPDICDIYINGGQHFYPSMGLVYSCPGGGSLSAGMCMGAASCVAPETRGADGLCSDSTVCPNPGDMHQGHIGGPCAPVSCPSSYYVDYPASNVYDCVVTPPDCPSNVPLCANPQYTCMGESSTPTTVPACDNNGCDPGFHLQQAEGGEACAPDAESLLICPENFQQNLNGTACVESPPIVCDGGLRRGYVNGSPVCVSVSSVPPGVDVPSENTSTTSGTSTTNTVTNQDGSTTSTTTSNSTTSLDTTGLAKDSTLKGILDTLNHSSGSGILTGGGLGAAPADSISSDITAKKSELISLWQTAKADFIALTPSLSGGGAYTCDAAVTTSFGASIDFCLGNHINLLVVMGNALYLVASVAAVLLILG